MAQHAQSAGGGGLDKPEHDRFAFSCRASLSGQDLREAPKARCQIMFAGGLRPSGTRIAQS